MGQTHNGQPRESESGASVLPIPQVAYILKPRPAWNALRALALVFKVFAWVSGRLGAIGVIIAVVVGSQIGSPGAVVGLGMGVAAVMVVGGVFLGLYGYSELMLVLVAIEENTRKL